MLEQRRSGARLGRQTVAAVVAQAMLKRELADDGLHPNKAGYAVMAPLAEKAIAKALQ